jgi:hypothetical protein
LFQSLGGHSQIVISQVSIGLNVNYDDDYAVDATKRLAYLQERVPLVYRLCEIAGARPAFSGLTGKVKLASDASDTEILEKLVAVTGVRDVPDALNEFSLRVSAIVQGRFFDNVTLQSFREWVGDNSVPVQRLSNAEAKSRGVEILQDFNDRYAYNEQSGYLTSESVGLEIVARAHDSLDAWVRRFSGGDE